MIQNPRRTARRPKIAFQDKMSAEIAHGLRRPLLSAWWSFWDYFICSCDIRPKLRQTFLDRPGRREAAGRGHSQDGPDCPVSGADLISNLTSIINLPASLSDTRLTPFGVTLRTRWTLARYQSMKSA